MSLLASRQQAGASSSGAARGQLRQLCVLTIGCRQGRCCRAQRVAPCASSSGSSGPSNTFAKDAQAAAERAFKQARKKWDTFAKEQDLERKANATLKNAGAALRDATDQAKDKARRMFTELDSEYELSSKTARAAKRAEEVARDIDQTYGVRRRLRSARDYVTRMRPIWQQQFNEFSSTWYGKAVVITGLCVLVSTQAFWSLLNGLLLLWWLSLPVSLVLLDVARRQQAERLQQEAAAAERARRSANPFAEMFRDVWSAAGSGRGAGGSAGGSSWDAGRSRGYTQQEGPIIDAEWTSIDEEDEGKGGKGSKKWQR